MKNIKDIASGGKFVQWQELAEPIDENFAELNDGKLSKSELAQTTGSSTTIPMNQDAVTKALAGLLPNQRADNTPYISVVINDGDSGQNWETFNRKLDEIASMPDPMPYNGDIRYFISEGLRVDVTNRIFDSSEGASRRLTQVVTGNVRLDDRLDLALAGDIDQSFWRIYKEGAWSEWKAVNAGGGSGGTVEGDGVYVSTLNLKTISGTANASQKEEVHRIIDAIEKGEVVIYKDGASTGYNEVLYMTAYFEGVVSDRTYYVTAISTNGILYKASFYASSDIWGGGDSFGSWSVKSQDLSNLANNGYNVLIHGEYAHGEGVSSELAYEGSTIPSDIQQVMMEWYMSPTGYAIAYGQASHVEGSDCLALSNAAHAEGIKTLASNGGAHAEGTGTNAAGQYAHAEGQNTTANAQACHSEGAMCVCNGIYGHVEGFRCMVENTSGHAEGYITYCFSSYGHSEGKQTSSVGFCSHSEGCGEKIERSITITNIYNIEGDSSSFTADNISNLEEGVCFIINKIPYAILRIEGDKIYVNRWIEFQKQKYDIIIMRGCSYGDHSHHENESNSAIGRSSSVSGTCCIAYNQNEFACGQYNYSEHSDTTSKRTLFSIGIGTDKSRLDGVEMKLNGDLYIFGIGGYNGNNSSEAKTIQAVISELLNKIQKLESK